jgi:tetratricopeptide (TPR) repeat protein
MYLADRWLLTPRGRILAALATVILLGGCGTTVLRQVARGDAALARGDYERAEREYARALALDPDEEGRGEWARARIEAGRAEIRNRRRKRLRPWQDFTGTAPAILDQLHQLRLAVRADGGDDELDATLERLSRRVLAALVAELEPRAAREPYGLAREAVPLVPYGYLDRGLADRASALVTAGRERAELDAVGVGDQRPLARRVYQALAAELGGAALDDQRALVTPFGVGVTYRGDGGRCDAGGWFAAASPTATRQATVELVHDRCLDTGHHHHPHRGAAVDGRGGGRLPQRDA